MAAGDSELGGFLRSRRARANPRAFSGTPSKGRRVPGLRREEVAALAGISVEYYARLERGRTTGVSDSVLYAIARALNLDDLETAHLFDLAHSMTNIHSAAGGQDHHRDEIRPALHVIVDALSPLPAWISNHRTDFLAGNREARALYAPLFTDPGDNGNYTRFIFLNPVAKRFQSHWEQIADEVVGALRRYSTHRPDDRKLTELIRDLTSRSAEFRTRWADHDIVHHRAGDMRLNHPTVGELDLPYERLDVPRDPDLSLFIHLVEPGSTTAERLAALVDAAGSIRP
jgi:transcriptional regulator with XRE-family HTH domain